MPFDANRSRSSTGVTLDTVHQAMFKLVSESGIVDPSAVRAVLDDEVIPLEDPPKGRFITVRLPSVIWNEGDVFIGGGNISEFWVQGQVRISAFLRNEADTWGAARAAIDEAIAPEPRGAKFIGRLVSLFWEDDLLDSTGLTAILKRPMKFISLEPPNASRSDWRPWRLTVELEWKWALSLERLPGN